MNNRDVAKQVIAKMLPTSNQRGVDLDEPLYERWVKEAAKEHDCSEDDVDTEVRMLLNEVAQFGFSVL